MKTDRIVVLRWSQIVSFSSPSSVTFEWEDDDDAWEVKETADLLEGYAWKVVGIRKVPFVRGSSFQRQLICSTGVLETAIAAGHDVHVVAGSEVKIGEHEQWWVDLLLEGRAHHSPASLYECWNLLSQALGHPLSSGPDQFFLTVERQLSSIGVIYDEDRSRFEPELGQ